MIPPPLDLQTRVHRRRNRLTGEWVLVSPHRSRRPWQGQEEVGSSPAGPAHDPSCYLCPGNTRAGGIRNPAYRTTYIFDNDFAALTEQPSSVWLNPGGLLEAKSEAGLCRVICYAPEHNLALSQLPMTGLADVIDAWCAQSAELGARPDVGAVTIFENRGSLMGASSPHPHGQIWATESIPHELCKETETQRQHLEEKGSCLLCDYIALEERDGERLLYSNADFVVLLPFWAVWPFETLVLPRAHHGRLFSLSARERNAYADALKQLTTAYDALFQVPFPYTMGIHQSPMDGASHDSWHLHTHFYPPLLRSASIRKFMVGFEMLAGPQRDITPEAAAALLRESFD